MKLTDITTNINNLGNKSLAETIGMGSDLVDNSSNTQISFEDVLKNSIEELNSEQVEAYKSMSDIATGKVENLQEAVKQIEEAELSLKLALEVKNKALGAYKQVMSMQI